MRLGLTPLTLAGLTLIAGSSVGAARADAQTRVTSLDALRCELKAGDLVTVVPDGGRPIVGRLTRLSTGELDVRTVGPRPPSETTIRFDAIQSLERKRDPVGNGAAGGALVGAAASGALFVYALAVDRNELDEWAGTYAGLAGASIGIGALVGWAVDAARSKPPIRYERPPGDHAAVSVRPLIAPRRSVAVVVSFGR